MASFQRSRNSSTETSNAPQAMTHYDKDLAEIRLSIQEIQKDLLRIRHTARSGFFGGWLSDVACAVFLALVVRALWHDYLSEKKGKQEEAQGPKRSS
jgi:hypothetical protein